MYRLNYRPKADRGDNVHERQIRPTLPDPTYPSHTSQSGPSQSQDPITMFQTINLTISISPLKNRIHTIHPTQSTLPKESFQKYNNVWS